MAGAGFEHNPGSEALWPPDSMLAEGQQNVWESYVGAVVLPSLAIWRDMGLYLAEQPPQSFAFYRDEKAIKAHWHIEKIVEQGSIDRGFEISAAITGSTPVRGELQRSDEFRQAAEHLSDLDRSPAPEWPSLHKKPLVPAEHMLSLYPNFGWDAATTLDLIEVNLRASGQYGSPLTKATDFRVLWPNHLTLERTQKLQWQFRPKGIFRNLRRDVRGWAADAGQTLSADHPTTTAAAIEQVLRDSLTWAIPSGFKELRSVHRALAGQLEEWPAL